MERWATSYLAAQAAYLRHLATAPVAEVFESDGLFAVRTGLPSNTENGVISSGDLRPSDALIEETIDWLNKQGLPAAWLITEGEAREETVRALVAAGCQAEIEGYEMRAALAPLNPAEVTLPANVSISEVTSSQDLDAWLQVAAECCWFDTAAERRAWKELYAGLGGGSANVLYLAYRAGRPVGMAAAFYTEDVVLLTTLAVLESDRRQGIGRALALTRLLEAQRRGCRTAVLAPSPDGAELYGSLGFERHMQPRDRWLYLPSPDSLPAQISHG